MRHNNFGLRATQSDFDELYEGIDPPPVAWAFFAGMATMLIAGILLQVIQ